MATSIITVTSSGNFNRTNRFLKSIKNKKIYQILDSYGQKGVSILRDNTPIRTGASASSWTYKSKITNSSIVLEWHNTNLSNDGKTPVVVLIIKGHGTRTGGYVAPNDFVTPVMEDLFREAVDSVWKAVISS